jgi:hypothetical protein
VPHDARIRNFQLVVNIGLNHLDFGPHLRLNTV